jgi:hypothetical protein
MVHCNQNKATIINLKMVVEINKSYVVEHTAYFLITYTSFRLSMVVMQLRRSHSQRTQWGAWAGRCQASTGRNTGGDRCRSCHMSRCLGWEPLPPVHLGHSSHTPASKSRILIAISPAVDSTLNQAPLPPQCWVKLC